MIERGYTWTEQHRHECEVRYILSMPSRQARADYLDSLLKRRGEAAVQRLRDDITTAWNARRQSSNPAPLGLNGGAAAPSPVHLTVNSVCTTSVPVHGSFLDPGDGGNSDPERCVDSGVAA